MRKLKTSIAPPEVVQAIREVVSYCWLDEQRHYDASGPAEREGHVYEKLKVVRGWLNRQPAVKIIKRKSA